MNIKVISKIITNAAHLDGEFVCGTPPFSPKRWPPFCPPCPWPRPFEQRAYEVLNMKRPPEYAVAAIISSGIVEILNKTKDVSLFENESRIKEIHARAVNIAGELIDWCGTKSKQELIRKLLSLLDLKFFPMPQPDDIPWAKQVLAADEQVFVYAVVSNAAEHFGGAIHSKLGSLALAKMENQLINL